MNIRYDVKSQEQARQLAIDWQRWQAEERLSWGELLDWYAYFTSLGEAWELTEKFNEEGII